MQERFQILGLLGAVMFMVSCGTTSTPVTEDDLIARLASPNSGVVVSALQALEKQYPTSRRAVPEMKRLLTDDRERVRRKAARVLGVLHAEVSADDIDKICAMLNSSEPGEVIDALKSLRGLEAPQAVSKITPLLSHSHPNVVRDACRTLAVLGDPSLIPLIEPLLQNSDRAVRTDAQDAIFTLQNKS